MNTSKLHNYNQERSNKPQWKKFKSDRKKRKFLQIFTTIWTLSSYWIYVEKFLFYFVLNGFMLSVVTFQYSITFESWNQISKTQLFWNVPTYDFFTPLLTKWSFSNKFSKFILVSNGHFKICIQIKY